MPGAVDSCPKCPYGKDGTVSPYIKDTPISYFWILIDNIPLHNYRNLNTMPPNYTMLHVTAFKQKKHISLCIFVLHRTKTKRHALNRIMEP